MFGVNTMRQLFLYHFIGCNGFAAVYSQIVGILSTKLPAQDAEAVEFALNEAVSNALRYGPRGAGEAAVTVKMRFFPNRLVLRIKDQGQGFPAVEKMQEVQKKMLGDIFAEMITSSQGRGIIIMLSVVDRVLYNSSGNEVMLIKRIA